MKKAGIITVSRTNNYGAELQAYALQKKLRNMGYDAVIIDYLYYKHLKYKYTKESAPDVSFSFSKKLKQFVLYRLLSPIIELVMPLFIFSLKTRTRRFHNFHNNHVRFSKQYRSLTELKNANHNYDIYIAGSDQVWNPSTGTSLSPYFLEFAPKDKLKISYASSFGVSAIDKKYYSLYNKYLNNLDIISVRENDGVHLVREITGREATRVLDPTLLLTKDEWLKVIDNPLKLPLNYLVIYQLCESESIIELAYHVAKLLNLEIILITKRAFLNKKYKNIVNITDAGPSEFIEIFSKASYVITNSFHGTAFSINFNIPFYTVLNPVKKNNSRMVDFLNLMNLESRIIWEKTDVPKDDLINCCNFEGSNSFMIIERMNSIKYLDNLIKE
jgi:hypothetical protein